MYAIIKTGGKQLKVEVGQAIYVEKLNVAEGEVVTFDEVLFVGGENAKVGAPLVEGATVTAKVEKHGKGEKISRVSNTNLKKVTKRNKVTVNHTLKWLSKLSMLNY